MLLMKLVVVAVTVGLPYLRVMNSPQGGLSRSEWAAFHKQDVSKWAERSTLPTIAVEKLLQTVGRGVTEEDHYLIQNVDTASLKQRRQILLALTDFGSAHALTVYVVESVPDYKKVWEVSGISEWNGCSALTFTTESVLGEAMATATREGKIVVKMPVRKESKESATTSSPEESELLVAEYVWSKNEYKLGRVWQYPRYKWNGKELEEQGVRVVRRCKQAKTD